ncbi:MAG: DUF89 family protein [Ruminococcaceae bacterium]|nr:DUF89 family protein [Oscillospiraceae bacterium]
MKDYGVNMNTLCIQCLLNKHLESAREYGTAEQANAFCADLLKVLQEALDCRNSAWAGAQVNKLYAKHFGMGQDRFAEEKRISNEFVMERMDAIRSRIQAQPDPVFAALQFAILGNYLDFSALKGQVSFEKLEEMLEDALQMQLDQVAYQRFLADLQQGKRLLYVTDNAGEIGFDRLLAQELSKRFPHLEITFCVRGLPAHNDATREDAAFVGLEYPMVDTGNDIGGVEFSMISRECQTAFDESDVIISKGMGNVETMYGYGYNIYYAFLVKCPRIIEFFGKEKFTPMFLAEKT